MNKVCLNCPPVEADQSYGGYGIFECVKDVASGMVLRDFIQVYKSQLGVTSE